MKDNAIKTFLGAAKLPYMKFWETKRVKKKSSIAQDFLIEIRSVSKYTHLMRGC